MKFKVSGADALGMCLVGVLLVVLVSLVVGVLPAFAHEERHTEREEFAHMVLDELRAPRSDRAIAVIVGWTFVEGCSHHNWACILKPNRLPYQYGSAAEGARVLAAQLDRHHPARGDSIYSYPALVTALRRADEFPLALDVIANAEDELCVWLDGKVTDNCRNYLWKMRYRTNRALAGTDR